MHDVLLRTARQRTVTRLLGEFREGRRESFDRLFPLVYEELRVIARRERRGGRGSATLDTHALVHEAYLRLVDQSRADWKSRGHFGAVASKAMRHILIDYARRRRAAKRGGGQVDVQIEEVEERLVGPDFPGGGTEASLLALDAALDRLAALSPRQARIVELKFFGGLTIDEIAAALELSSATVKRGWSTARAWLYREIAAGER